MGELAGVEVTRRKNTVVQINTDNEVKTITGT